MKRILVFIAILLLSNNANAEMCGKQQIIRIDPRNQFLYATYSETTDCMYFWIPGKLGFSNIFQYHPSSGWTCLTSPWIGSVKTMIVSDGILYYSVPRQLDARGRASDLYALDLKTRRTTHLMRNELVIDIEAAGNERLLVNLRGYKDTQQSPGYYFYDLTEKKFTELDMSDYNRISFMEKGIALGKPDDKWCYYDYSTERIAFEINFSTKNYVNIYSPRYWTEQLMSEYDTLIYLDGKMIYHIEGYDGITENDQYVLWYKAPRGKQQIHVLDVYASENAPQISEYEVNVMSNIYLLDHYAVMLSDENTTTLTLIDLKTGNVTSISP